MKEYIVLKIEEDTIIFDYRSILEEEKVFLNKNDLYKDSLFYGIKYYKKHEKKIVEMLLQKYKSFSTLKVSRLVTFKYVAYLISMLNIENLVLDFSSTIDLQDYKLFLGLKSLKNISCYYMPKGIKRSFNSNGINVYTSSLKEITDKFLMGQDAFENDTLYYKNVIKIKSEYPELLSDLKEFLKINYNLKAIHLYIYSKELIEGIVDLVKNDESRNVVVFLHQGYDKGDFISTNFEWLKKLSDKCKKDYTCEFRIIYANQFLRNNLFKQLTFNNLKLISILSVYVCIVSLIIIKSYDYIEKISVDQLKAQLLGDASSVINDEDEDEDYNYMEELPDQDVENNINNSSSNSSGRSSNSNKETKSRYSFSNSMAALKKINKDTKGYLIVKDTNISYPVVQSSDNNYYLTHDIYKNKASIGWIFFDYRNNTNGFDDNNIIYGHSMLNGMMFGTLKKTLNTSWRKNPDNLIISLDKEDGSYKFKIFSIYKVDYTTDYLKINFDSSEEKEEFIKLIKGRSNYKNDTPVNIDDKILTLSTCFGSNNKRLVVHAVLLKEGEEN